MYCYLPHCTVWTAESAHRVCRVQDPQGFTIGPCCTTECHICTGSCHIDHTNWTMSVIYTFPYIETYMHIAWCHIKGKWSGFCLQNWRWRRLGCEYLHISIHRDMHTYSMMSKWSVYCLCKTWGEEGLGTCTIHTRLHLGGAPFAGFCPPLKFIS